MAAQNRCTLKGTNFQLKNSSHFFPTFKGGKVPTSLYWQEQNSQMAFKTLMTKQANASSTLF
jgi:hypothetical protein